MQVSSAVQKAMVLALGPRNRRRLALGAGVAGVIVAVVVVAVVLTRPTSSSGRARTLSSPGGGCVRLPDSIAMCGPTGPWGRVTFGMTRSQVRTLVGKPAATLGDCWRYPQPVSKYLAAYGVVKTVQEACFFGGTLSDTPSESYVRRHGKLVLWHPPKPKLSFP
jgi:hypothetical protein